ncbi:MAG: nucleotide pyrophosphohydrolase [Candidatus Heimdallarchaeota archaeon]|nr:nucleotide pyrophosphohydrolase [Candidatus Heimdallarchaeota archaeon]
MESLTTKIIEFRDARKWKEFHTPKNLALSLVIETGELFEIMQWKEDQEILADINKLKPQLEDEIADIAIYLFLLAHEFGINLSSAIPRKIAKNWKKYPLDKKAEFEKDDVLSK